MRRALLMGKKPPLSKGELEVARVLWDLNEATPRQVYEVYCKKRAVSFETVQTFLLRLEAKGYLRARRKGKKKFYRPRVRPGTVIRETIDDISERLFDGETLPLIRHLICDRGISDEELKELRRLLDQLDVEDCRIEFAAGEVGKGGQQSPAHGPGVVEHIFVTEGRARVGPVDAPVELDTGDYLRMQASAPHLYEGLGGPARLFLVMQYPRR